MLQADSGLKEGDKVDYPMNEALKLKKQISSKATQT